MTEKQIESLLGQLSDKLKVLQVTYSDFAEKCEKPTRDYSQNNEKPNLFQVFTGVKAEVSANLNILIENKKVILKKLESLEGLEQGIKVKRVKGEYKSVAKGLEQVEKSLFLLFEDLDELEKNVKSKIQEDSESIQRLKYQCQNNRRTQSLDYWQESPIMTSRNIELNTQYYEETECQQILEKMSSLTDRIHYKADLFDISQNNDFLRTKGLGNNKLVHNLESEINRLRTIIRNLEEKEIRAFEFRAKYESSQFQSSELMNKVEFLEKTLAEKEFKTRQLLKTVEESHKERKKTFESLNKCRKEFEYKLEEQCFLIKELTEEKNEQYLVIKTLNYQLETLEKEKNELDAEKNRVKTNLDISVKKLQELDLEFNQKIAQTEKNSEMAERLLKFEAERNEVIDQLNKCKDLLKSKSSESESLKNSLKSSKIQLNEAKSNLNTLFLEYEALKSLSLSNETSKSLQIKLEETQTLNLDYHDQITSLQSSYNTLQQNFTILESKSAEQSETIKELEKKLSTSQPGQISVAEVYCLKKNNESLIKDNQSLIDSQAFMTTYIENLISSHKATINDLNCKLEESLKKIEDLSEALNCQQYLYNDLEKKVKNDQIIGFRPIHRHHTSSEINKNVLKSIETMKKLFETQSFDTNIMAMIGVELDEEDPQKFYEKILEIKKERDRNYLAVQKYEDLIFELKEELNEENEFNLLARVVNLKKS